MTKPATQSPPEDEIQGPAVITPLHRKDRDLYCEKTGALIIGKKGNRRQDNLRWLLDHKSIAEHQYQAGRRLQTDWEQSKIEVLPRMTGARGGLPSSTLSDAALDAGTRFKDALAVIPQSCVTLLTIFLLPEDHPMSLERCAAIVKRNPKAASFGIQISLDLLARHYGFST